MQSKIILNPNYNGPSTIDFTLKKMKASSGLGRMISTYNKRYFILDLQRLLFYYLPDRSAHFSNATNISLDDITAFHIDHQMPVHDESNIWKYGLIIVTKKRVFRLVSHSQDIIEKVLFTFSNLINITTQKPLFDWNSYKKTVAHQNFHLPSNHEVLSDSHKNNPMSIAPLISELQSPLTEAKVEKENVRRLEEFEESAKKRLAEKFTTVIFNGEEITFSSDKKKNIEDSSQKSLEYQNCSESSKQSFEVPNVVKNKTTDIDQLEQKENQTNFEARLNEAQQCQEEVDPSQNKVEILSLDEPECKNVSSRVELVRRRSVKKIANFPKNSNFVSSNSKFLQDLWSENGSKPAQEKDFLRLNRVGLSGYGTNENKNYSWDDEKKAMQTVSSQIEKDKQTENEILHRNMPELNSKSFEGVNIQKQQNNQEQKDESTQSTTKKNTDDDDWDREMFAGEYEKVAKMTVINNLHSKIQSQNPHHALESRIHKSQNINKYQNKVNQFKINESSHECSEIKTGRTEVHNDWDDEL